MINNSTSLDAIYRSVIHSRRKSATSFAPNDLYVVSISTTSGKSNRGLNRTQLPIGDVRTSPNFVDWFPDFQIYIPLRSYYIQHWHQIRKVYGGTLLKVCKLKNSDINSFVNNSGPKILTHVDKYLIACFYRFLGMYNMSTSNSISMLSTFQDRTAHGPFCRRGAWSASPFYKWRC